jgi:hypothetical protein
MTKRSRFRRFGAVTPAVPGLLSHSAPTPEPQEGAASASSAVDDHIRAQAAPIARARAEQAAQTDRERRRAARPPAEPTAEQIERAQQLAAARHEKIVLLYKFSRWATHHHLPATRIRGSLKGWWVCQKGGERIGGDDDRRFPARTPVYKVGVHLGSGECGDVDAFSLNEIIAGIARLVGESGHDWD